MRTLRGWIALSWVGLLMVMSVGSLLLRRFASLGDGPTPFQAEWLRAGHAHGGVLMLMSLLYYLFMDQTALPIGVKRAASSALLVGILAQFRGFFLHAIVGKPSQASIGTAYRRWGGASGGRSHALVCGLITTRSTSTSDS